MKRENSLQGVRILAVDDDRDTREMLRFVFEQAGGHVTEAGSVEEAVDALHASPPDVLIADIGMPDRNGYALIALVRELDKELGRTTPAIALTAYTSPADEQTALLSGFQRYSSKPFDPEELIQTVRSLTEKGNQ